MYKGQPACRQTWASEPIPLISVDPSTNKFVLTPQGEKFLSSLNDPIAIVSVAGLYRTGKSFLVNSIIPHSSSQSSLCKENQSQGFRVGTTTQSATKGLNIWGQPITIYCEETGEDIQYLVIDSQGIGSCEKDSQYDTNLLILVFLLSSTVVYNSVGAIDETGLEQLEVILKLRKCVEDRHSYFIPKDSASEDKCQDSEDESFNEREYEHEYKIRSDHPPKFIWALRDFALQLTDKDGRQMTADQYLENCLQETSLEKHKGNSASVTAIRKKNSIRKAIKDYLPDRSCSTLVRPTIKEDDLHRLTSNHHDLKLRGQFLQQIQNLRNKIFSGNLRDVKCFNGEKISGRLYCRILKEYILILNEGKLPSVKDVWDSVMSQKCEQILEQFVLILSEQIQNKVKLPIYDKQSLKLRVNEIQNSIFGEMMKKMGLQQSTKQKNISKVDGSLDTKKAHFKKQFIKAAQKINKELDIKNNELINSRTMDGLRKLVKENVNLEQIFSLSSIHLGKNDKQVFSVTQFLKNFLQKAKGKIVNGQTSPFHEPYQYLFTVFIDVVYILQTKWNKVAEEMQQMKNVFQQMRNQKIISDAQMINLKKQYHQALRSIGKFQEDRSGYDKRQITLQGKIMDYERKLSKIQAETAAQRLTQERKKQSLVDKLNEKQEQMLKELRKQRDKNQKLNQELQETKTQLQKKELAGRKEIIFEEKIKSTYDKFDQIKLQKERELSEIKGHLLKKQTQYSQLQELYKIEVNKRQKLENNFKKKEENLLKQFESLKQCMKNTKQSYELTYKTMRNGDQVCKDLSNIATSKKKKCQKSINKRLKTQEVPSGDQNDIPLEQPQASKSDKLLRNYYHNQLEKQKEEFQESEKKLQQKIIALMDSIQREKLNKQNYFEEAKEYKEKCIKLELQVNEANIKFGGHLKEIQEARERERSIYEESILRLLQNVDRKQGRSSLNQTDKGRRMR